MSLGLHRRAPVDLVLGALLVLATVALITAPARAQTARKATLTSPTPGSTLSGATATFQWTAGALATEYWFDVGTTPGGNQLFNRSTGMARSVTVSGLPIDGRTVFVRIWTRLPAGWEFNAHMFSSAGVRAALTSPASGTKLGGSSVTFTWSPVRVWTLFPGGWVFNGYSFTAAGVPGVQAALTGPTPGSKLSGSVVTFDWDAGTNAIEYWLDVNTGGTPLHFNQSTGLGRSATVSNLPVDGRGLIVRLWTKLGPTWGSSFRTYTFTAAGIAGQKAVLQSPSPGSTLPAGPVTFRWSTGTGATAYWLDVLSGQTTLFTGGTGLATQVTVPGLPADGRALVVRVWTKFASGWQFTDYPVTAALVTTSTFDAFQQHNLGVINGYRATRGLSLLVLDQQLSTFALAGSQQLSVDHVPHKHFTDAAEAGTLFTVHGFRSSAAENQGDPNGWPVMASDPTANTIAQIDDIQRAMFDEGPGGGHYENMMASRFTRVGIGLQTVNGRLYLTNDFSQ